MENFIENIKKIKEKGAYRELKDQDLSGKHLFRQERNLLNFSSNDYLGFAQKKSFLKEFYSKLDQDTLNDSFRLGASSSRLITGNHAFYEELEDLIARSYQKEACLVYSSGYHANTGILPALSSKKDLILSDKLNHASIVDALKLSDAEHLRFRHLDYQQLESIIEKKRHLYQHVFIVSESVFSMDGDTADLKELVRLKQKYDCLLYIDEAHALGAIGDKGLGLCEQENYIQEIDLIIGTFGKTLASQGAFVVSNAIFKDLLVNRSRTLIYTTALPPISLNWNKFIFQKSIESEKLRDHLHELSAFSKKQIKAKLGIHTNSQSNIVPIVIGANENCIEIAKSLETAGFLCTAIRPPSVPENTSRLRISLNTELSKQDITNFVDELSKHIDYIR